MQAGIANLFQRGEPLGGLVALAEIGSSCDYASAALRFNPNSAATIKLTHYLAIAALECAILGTTADKIAARPRPRRAPSPAVTAQKQSQVMLEIANAIEADHACRLSVAAINIRNFEMQAATPMSTVLRFPPQSRRAGCV
jgi:hypothetical protein